MICKSCGAEVSQNDARCPYCNTMIAQGAEKAFMRKLHGMKEELGSSEIDPSTQLGKEAMKSVLKLLPILLAASIVLFLIIMGNGKVDDISDNHYESKQYEKMLTLDAITEELDALYATGKYDEMLEIIRKNGMNIYSASQYDHFMVLEATEMLNNAHTRYAEAVSTNYDNWLSETGTINYAKLPYNLRSSIQDLFNFAIFNYQGHEKRVKTNADLVILSELRDEAESFLRNEMQLTDEMMARIYAEAENYGFVSSSAVETLWK